MKYKHKHCFLTWREKIQAFLENNVQTQKKATLVTWHNWRTLKPLTQTCRREYSRPTANTAHTHVTVCCVTSPRRLSNELKSWTDLLTWDQTDEHNKTLKRQTWFSGSDEMSDLIFAASCYFMESEVPLNTFMFVDMYSWHFAYLFDKIPNMCHFVIKLHESFTSACFIKSNIWSFPSFPSPHGAGVPQVSILVSTLSVCVGRDAAQKQNGTKCLAHHTKRFHMINLIINIYTSSDDSKIT